MYIYFVQLRIAKVNTKTPTTFFSTYGLRWPLRSGLRPASGAPPAGISAGSSCTGRDASPSRNRFFLFLPCLLLLSCSKAGEDAANRITKAPLWCTAARKNTDHAHKAPPFCSGSFRLHGVPAQKGETPGVCYPICRIVPSSSTMIGSTVLRSPPGAAKKLNLQIYYSAVKKQGQP